MPSNYKTVINFRDGIQVDTDDLISNNGLVGIGSTIPRQQLDVRGNVIVSDVAEFNNIKVTGVTTFASNVENIVSSGVITATTFSGNITGTSVTFTSGTFTGDVSIGGTLTYEDITDIDSVGVGTFNILTADAGSGAGTTVTLTSSCGNYAAVTSKYAEIDTLRAEANSLISKINTVKVTEKFKIEKYSHVMHIVSEVEGILEKGKDVWDLLMASFPAGTVSGAPKIRAMQLIHELESQARGPYSGVYGSLDLNGALNTAITIRTMLVSHHSQDLFNVEVQAGAGIVADSIPQNEFQETLNKAKGMFTALACLETPDL